MNTLKYFMNEQQHRVEQYLMGQLKDNDRLQFERELANDPSLKSELNLAQQEQDALDLIVEKEVRQKVRQWQQPDSSDTTPAIWLIVVFIAGLALGLWHFLPSDDMDATLPDPELKSPSSESANQSDNKVLATVDTNSALSPVPNKTINTKTYPKPVLAYNDQFLLSAVRGQNKRPEPVETIFELYRNGQYASIIQQTDNITRDNYHLTLTELRAHAFYHLRQFDKAAAEFQILAESDREPFAERSDWYLLHCYAALLPASASSYQKQYRKIADTPGHPWRDSL